MMTLRRDLDWYLDNAHRLTRRQWVEAKRELFGIEPVWSRLCRWLKWHRPFDRVDGRLMLNGDFWLPDGDWWPGMSFLLVLAVVGYLTWTLIR